MSEKLKDLTDSQKIERSADSFNFRNLLSEGIADFANNLNKNLDKSVSEELRAIIFESAFRECLGDVIESLKWSKGYINKKESNNPYPK